MRVSVWGLRPPHLAWRDASAALWILSGIYLILQAILSFGLGGYVVGRVRTSFASGPVEQTEQADGLHGLAVWALAVVMGAILATLLGGATLSRNSAAVSSREDECGRAAVEL